MNAVNAGACILCPKFQRLQSPDSLPTPPSKCAGNDRMTSIWNIKQKMHCSIISRDSRDSRDSREITGAQRRNKQPKEWAPLQVSNFGCCNDNRQAGLIFENWIYGSWVDVHECVWAYVPACCMLHVVLYVCLQNNNVQLEAGRGCWGAGRMCWVWVRWGWEGGDRRGRLASVRCTHSMLDQDKLE